MRRVTSLTLLAIVAISWAGLYAGHADDLPTANMMELEEGMYEKGTVATTMKDVAVTLKGKVEQDWIGYDKIFTLHPSNDDQMSGFRTRTNIDVCATYGEKKFGKSAADAKIRLSSYNFWKREGYYTPFKYETDSPLITVYDQYFDIESTKFAHDIKHDVRPKNIMVYIEEAWLDLHFGTFFKAFDNWYSYEKHPLSVKVGYFPYKLGRGITLGEFPVHIPYLGWDSDLYNETRYPHPGILLHGHINKDIAYELYYSKHGENSLYTHMTWEETNFNKIGRRKQRGLRKETDVFAAQMELNSMRSWGDLTVKPYAMYIDAPELKVEVLGDSSARIGTVGMMAEYKKGRFSMNVEAAGQFGHQNMYEIDRNRIVWERDSTGDADITAKFTHVFTSQNSEVGQDAGGNYLLYVNHVYNRGGYDPTTRQWVKAVTKNGDVFRQTGNAYNSNVTGDARFRDAYRIDYRGFMGVVDMMYSFEETPGVTIAAAAAYISGDKYPYNTDRDKRYKAFIPFGDYYYTGKYVHSQIVLEERKLPRPVDISLHHQYAHNNVEDMSNLAYLGLGTKWKPFKNEKDKLLLCANVLWFWETTTLKKWSQSQPLPGTYRAQTEGNPFRNDQFIGEISWLICDDTGVWRRDESTIPNKTPIGDVKYVGWKTCDNASRELGMELNFEAQYRPVPNCMVKAQLACFIPGQLYEDLAGQPNVNTINGPKADDGIYGLGHDPVWRAVLSADFRF